ncbi:MAG: apolipoprotein A1/A4/E family protein [Gammaproteobacteria bacterium]|nr:apolipoprotein A1/A4/E family protein [Gammaproteobacteria bacterium]
MENNQIQETQEIEKDKKPSKLKLAVTFVKAWFNRIWSFSKRVVRRIMTQIWGFCKKRPIYSGIIITIVILAVVLCCLFVPIFHGRNDLHNTLWDSASVTNKQDVASLKIAKEMQQKEHNQQLTKELEQKLNAIQQEVNQSHQLSTQSVEQLEQQITALTQDIADIKQNAKEAKDSARQSVQTTQQHYHESKKQVAKVVSQLQEIHKQLEPQRYLPPSILPFEVVGLDFWNGKAMITVAVKDVTGSVHYRLMGQGMQFACHSVKLKDPGCTSWWLDKISPDSSTIIFKNSTGKKVRVEL